MMVLTSLLTSTLLAIGTGQGHGSAVHPDHGGAPSVAVNCCPDKCGHHLAVWGEVLYLIPRNAEVDYAQPVDSLGVLPLPVGPVAQVIPDYELAYRGGVTVWLCPQVALQASYTRFESSTEDSVFAPNDFLRSLVTHPSTLNNAIDSQSAFASHDIDFQTADFDVRIRVVDCNFCTLNLVGGFRYGTMTQDFLGVFSILGSTAVLTEIDFTGIGPRIGLDGEVALGWGMLVYGKGSASFLVGKHTADFTQVNQFAGLQAATGYEKNRIVPVLELELGVGFECCNGHLRVTAGYNVTSWMNIITTNTFIQSIQTNDFTSARDNLSDSATFDGLVGRVEVRW